MHPEKHWFLFPLPICSLWSVQTKPSIMSWRSHRFVYTLRYYKGFELSKDIGHTKWLSGILFCVCLRLSLSLRYILCNVLGCVCSIANFFVMTVRIWALYIIITIISVMWVICHCSDLLKRQGCATCVLPFFHKFTFGWSIEVTDL